MQITLDIFSGRPNPTWKLNSRDAKKLLERVESKALTDIETVDNVLGYRGIIVSVNTDDALPADLPSHFRIGGDLPAGFAAKASKYSALNLDESDEAVRWLLSTAKKNGGRGAGRHCATNIESKQSHQTERQISGKRSKL
jgi:hypothetical protein